MAQTIDTLLRLVPESPDTVLSHLITHSILASAADTSGYSLLHAAASYNQLELLRALVNTYHVSPNITDSEGETPLFAAENLAAAKCLVEELGADVHIRNEEGVSAEENATANAEDGGEWIMVADYLKRVTAGGHGEASNGLPALSNGVSRERANPPQLPPGVTITGMRAVIDEGEGDAPDPEFRRRIEELAARDDFQDEAGQTELRNLVKDAVGGLATSGDGRDVRRRVD